jgi:cytochrome c-type biogenesis protein CcmH
MRRCRAWAALVPVVLLISSGTASATTPRTSFTAVEQDLMCTSCHEPLALAQSPQAVAEKRAVKTLIAQGLSTKQIEANMVAQFGVGVLAKPPASGFNLTVYILPPAVLLIGLAVLGYSLPKWRERSRRAAATPLAGARPLTTADAARLDEDLDRFI